MGSDDAQIALGQLNAHFNPRSPCGERPDTLIRGYAKLLFQSTLPVWGATEKIDQLDIYDEFQSTLPVWGATGQQFVHLRVRRFQSTLPVWGATFFRGM